MYLLKQRSIHKFIVLGLFFSLSVSVFAEDLGDCIDSLDICTYEVELMYGDHDFETTKKLAMQGDIKAQRDLGYNYKYGFTIDKDLVEALKWLEKAANQGDADAQHSLAMMYSSGEGVNEDMDKAMQWYLKSADQGYVPAQSYLATRYFMDAKLNDDHTSNAGYTKAAEWATKAALQGDESSQRLLGLFYKDGYGVRKNKTIAREWYGKSCDSGKEFSCQEYIKLTN